MSFFFHAVAVSKSISKIVQSEGKVEKNSLKAAIGELKGIQKMQRVAVQGNQFFRITVHYTTLTNIPLGMSGRNLGSHFAHKIASKIPRSGYRCNKSQGRARKGRGGHRCPPREGSGGTEQVTSQSSGESG
jgi:hypothetical protein